MAAPYIALIDVFQRHRPRSGRFPIPLNRYNRAFHRVVPGLELPDLRMNLLIFFRQYIFDQREIFLLKNLGNF